MSRISNQMVTGPQWPNWMRSWQKSRLQLFQSVHFLIFATVSRVQHTDLWWKIRGLDRAHQSKVFSPRYTFQTLFKTSVAQRAESIYCTGRQRGYLFESTFQLWNRWRLDPSVIPMNPGPGLYQKNMLWLKTQFNGLQIWWLQQEIKFPLIWRRIDFERSLPCRWSPSHSLRMGCQCLYKSVHLSAWEKCGKLSLLPGMKASLKSHWLGRITQRCANERALVQENPDTESTPPPSIDWWTLGALHTLIESSVLSLLHHLSILSRKKGFRSHMNANNQLRVPRPRTTAH